jgi:arylsulfatase A-like enzyme
MNPRLAAPLGLLISALLVPALHLSAHTSAEGELPKSQAAREEMRRHLLEDFMKSPEGQRITFKTKSPEPPPMLRRSMNVASGVDSMSLLKLSVMASISPAFAPPVGNGTLMSASFAPFKPKVRFNWDGTTFFVEGDNTPDGLPNRMAGITSWQQQIPLPVAYFANTTNPENSASSLGYKQPNYWRLPLTPTPAASPTLIFTPGSTTNNFQRGAIALASNGVAIFNPANNQGRVSYEIGELDYYGGHCGLADDYHYHIIPTHLSSRFGGPLSDDKPLAWALDGYPIYGYVEPDGTARQALDTNGGHDHGSWGYHYHAVGTTAVDATHPYGTPQSPYTMTSFRGTVVNFGGQVDGQPEVGSIRGDGTGGYNAKPIAGAYIVAFMNPAPLATDGSGNLDLPAGVNLTGCSTTFGSTTVNCTSTSGLSQGMAIVGLGVSNNATVTQINSSTQFVLSAAAVAATTAQNFTAVSLAGASNDQFIMRVNMGGVDYNECWRINRNINPRTLTVTWRAQALVSGSLSGPVVTTTNTYTPNAGSPAAVNRLAPYVMSGPSQNNIPDTSQTIDTTATFGEDSDYSINPQSFTDNGNGTISDNITGLMWQKVDNGESTWETAVANAATVSTGGYTDWRLPTPSELFSIFNHNNANPALHTTFFPNNPAGAADYWWTSDIFSNSTTNVWCSNAGGGLGPKPKSETLSYTPPGAFRYHARYVRGKKPTNGHNYQNNGDGTVTDLDTGLMWTQTPGPAVTWDAAVSYAEGLTAGGFSDWRLPNVKELQTLTDYTLATATGAGTALKPSMNQTMFAKTLTNCTTSANGTTITCADTTGLLPGMPIVDDSSKDIAGAYIPYATPPVINQVTSPTTFTLTSGTGILAGASLTLKALAPPTAFWASTSQNNATANAWVVEFGTNATSSPQRNSQGIISQNVKTATYPVFAVRTTSITTQIAVAQGGTTLTNGVSSVGYAGSGTKAFTITNTGATSLTINSVTIDGANFSNFTLSGASANGTIIPANGTTTFNVAFSGTSAATYAAALHIASSDTAVGAAFDVNLSGTIPVVGNVVINPATPSSADLPYVTAKVTPIAGRTISQVQLTYNVGSQTTNTVFNETMAASATVTNPWDGVGVYNWTVFTGAGAGNITQVTAANHTATGQGNQCGLQFSKGSATATQTMVTTASSINTTGLSGYVEFYTKNVSVAAGLGWILQVSPDGGTTWNTRASNLTGTADSAFVLNHYDFIGSELTANLKLRFQFIGNGTGGAGATKTYIDDVVVKTVTGTPPVTVTMLDDGLHGDGTAGDGIYGVQLPAFAAGTNVAFSIAATDSTSVVTTLASAGSYTTTLPLSVTTISPLPNALTSAPYTQTLAATGGSGTGYTWAVTGGSLPSGVTLGTNGTFSGTATAAGTSNFTATVTDSVGHTASRAFAITASTPPNILIIVTDDQGWGDIGYHTYPGRVHIDTPNMDSFATSGIRMERFYPTAVCSVTRACLQTGRNSIRTGCNNARGLDLSEHIMPQTFSAAGYETFITGKWHIGGPENNICYKTVNGQTVRIIQEGDQYRPFNRGWKMHYGEYGVIDAFTHYSTGLLNPVTQPSWLRPDWWLNGTQYADSDATQHTDAQGHGGYTTDLLADKAASIITNANGDRDPSKPLLLYLPFSQIHGPVSAPPTYLAKYGNASDPTHYIADVPTRTIAASVDCMDVAIGRVFNALNTAGIANNTIVVFFSDNGGENATGGSDLPLRGAKTEPYDGGIRTPCGIRYPGKIAGGLQLTSCVTTSGTSVTCSSTTGLYAGMALAGTGLAYGTTVASVTDGTHFVLSVAPTTPTSGFTMTAGVISNQFLWVGDLFPTLCAASGVTPQNTKPFDGLNMWPAWQSISGANPDGTQTRFQTNPDGSKNTTTTNISPLVTLASPNVAYNTYTDPVSGQTKVFKDIYSPASSAVILTHCATVANSTTVTCDSTAGLTVGGSIYGVGLKGSATVVSITDATHFVMSDPPNVAYASITLNVGFPTNQLFNIQDDPYETTDLMLAVNQTTLGLTPTQITALNTIASAMQTSISINPNVYPPYVGPTLITNSAAQGSTIQLYVPFTSFAKNAPTINWRKNGVNLTDGTTASGSTIAGSTTFTVNTTSPDPGYGNSTTPTNGAYTTMLTITNVTTSDAGSYDVVINNVDTYQSPNVTNTVTSPAGTLSVVVGAPALAAEPTFTKGTSNTVSWSAITNATGYTVQAATDVNFTSIAASQTVTTTSATFTGLTSGTMYWFRATATDGVTTSSYSNVVSSTQDAGNPVVTIATPANSSTTNATSITVTGTATDSISGIASVTVNGVTATITGNNWSASNVPLSIGANTITATATDNAQTGGNTGTASITVTLAPNAPVISNVATGPTAPTYLDPVWVTAQVQAPSGATISQVKLSYDLGTPVSTTIFRETFNNTASNNWNGAVSTNTTLGALNAWTTVGAGNVRQAVSSSNNTSPVLLTGCSTAINDVNVTCTSTAGLWKNMLVTGPNIPGSTTGLITGNTIVSQITDATHFVLSQPASGSGTGLTLTAAGVTLTNCVTAVGTSVTCDSTAGLVNGMSLSGTGLANNATVSSVTNATTFVMNVAPTTPSSPSSITITASGAAAEFNGGTQNATDTMFTSTNAINTTGTAGYVEFYAQTRDLSAVYNNGWNFQVSSDNGATWNTRLSENYVGKSVNLTNCVLNSAGSGTGSTTVTCDSTTGLVAGMALQNAIATISVPNCTTSTTTTPTVVNCGNTSGLAVGMFISGTGIPANARISAITPNVSFTMTGFNATATGTTTVTAYAAPLIIASCTTVGPTPGPASATVTCPSTTGIVDGMFVTGTGIPANTRVLSHTATSFVMSAVATASGTVPVSATYVAANATVSSITNSTTFVLNTAAFANTSSPNQVSLTATAINHGFQLFHYDLVGAELGTNSKLRWQAVGYAAPTPLRVPRVDIDDVVVATTAPPQPTLVTMYDDGLHGDGAAGDGVYGAQVVALGGGTTVNFSVRATDSNANATTSTTYSYAVNPSLTTTTIKGAEFLGMPKSDGITINVIASLDQYAFVEYGTQPGKYTAATTPTLFTTDVAKPEFYNPIEITLTGLQPDTEYYYRVRHRNTTDAFYSARGERSFHTARPRGTTFTFTVTADPHLDVNSDHQLFWRAMQNIAMDNPDLHIDLGDIFMTDKLSLTDGTGIPAIWYGSQAPTLQRVIDRGIFFRNQFERCCHSIPFFFTLGNHEAEYGYLFIAATDKQNNIPAWDLRTRKAFYPTPVPDTFYAGNATPMDYTGGTLGLLEDYYAFEWGEALFIVLDPFWNTLANPNTTNDAWSWSLGQTQYNWLRDTLKNSSARYKFVFMHHIIGGSTTLADGVTKNIAARGGIEVSDKYEWGGNNADGSAGFATKRPGWDMPIHNLLVQNKVNVVFHGHDHLYGYQTRDGIVYLECPQPGTANYTALGSAGDGKYVDLGANSASQLLPNSGHIRVTVSPGAAVADYVRSYRTLSDAVPTDSPTYPTAVNDETASRHNRDISHSFTLTPTNYAPIEIANVGPGGVGLRWNAVPNKVYTIEWSVDLVNWTAIDTRTFTNTFTNATYTDTLPAHINGQRAFWRVRYTP